MLETPEERAAILQRMRDASNRFYAAAAAAGCHAFIEFTGLMNEYIKLCQEANEAGIEWVHANVHGDVHLPWKPHHIAYLSEKLECIYGRGLADGTEERKGFQAAIDVVKRRKEYYEMYRCNCNRIAPLDGHAVGCRAEAMETRRATFATIDDLLVHLEARLERLNGRTG
jgi:hypothetical protein